MFPPKPADKVTDWLENMIASLARGGLSVHENVLLDEPEDGPYNVELHLRQPVPKEGWPSFRNYVQQYALVSGWRVEKLRQSKSKLTFQASRA